MFEVGFGQSFIFSLRDINMTLGLLPSRRHVVWRNSVGAESSKLGLKSEFAQSFSRVLSRCYATLTSYNNSETAVYGYGYFGVVFMSCKVNFQVVRSALQYSASRI